MFEKVKNNKSKIISYILLILYAILTLVIVINHESWADEAQAWLIARDLNVLEIVKQMQYEGHSCLWHLILVPFAKSGLPFQTIKFVSWAFCLAAAWVVLMKSPFNKFIKIIIIFNPMMCYIFPAISRCYAMIPLFLSCICVIYPKREERPFLYAVFIALLANTHVVMEPLAAMLIFFFWGEKLIWKRKYTDNKSIYWKSFFIACLGILIFVAQVLPAVFNCSIIGKTEKISSLHNIKDFFAILRVPIDMMKNYLTYNTQWRTVLIYISILLLIFPLIKNPMQAFILIIEITFFLFVHAFVWFMIKQRAYIFILYILFFVWNCNRETKIFNKIPVYWFSDIAVVVLLLAIMGNFIEVKTDIEKPYSSSVNMAEFIEKEVPKGSVFICPNNEIVSAIIPYLNKEEYKFYSPNAERYYTFVTWDAVYQQESNIKNVEKAIKKLKNDGVEHIYVLNSKYMVFVEMILQHEKYDRIYEANVSYHDYYSQFEDYYLYKVNI